MQSIFRPGLFEGQTALITGGGTGIGLYTARLFGQLGGRVAICGRRMEKLEAAAGQLRAEGTEVFYATCDIRKPETIEALVGGAMGAFGKLDVLVNNAGGQFPIPAEACSPNGFAAVVRNNLLGTWNVTHAVANRAMIPAKRGRIINIIAQVARGFPGMVHTGAARAGVANMAKTLAVEWARYGIQVNAVAPGVIVTSGTNQYPAEMMRMARRAVPQKRLGQPGEVAEMILYLASPAASYITGQTLTIDGGLELWGDSWPIPDDVPTAEPDLR